MKQPNLIHVLIIAPDPVYAQGLAAGLQQADFVITGIAGHSMEATRLFTKNEVDIIVADTHLPGNQDGIDTVLNLLKIKRTPVIYLVALPDTGIISRAKQTNPAAIFIKPFTADNICMAMELALQNDIPYAWSTVTSKAIAPAPDGAHRKTGVTLENETILRQSNCIFIKRNFQFVKFGLGDILYMKAAGNYVHITLIDKKFTIRLSLTETMRKINYSNLVRINRFVVVNINAIESFNKEQVIIAQHEIAIGQNYKEYFFLKLGFHNPTAE
jgi:DNA-binding LytR/AlgR family response regulator